MNEDACLPLTGGPAENAKDASWTIPWSLVLSYFFNACMGFVAGVTVIFCAGDLDAVLANGTQQPFVTIFYNSTGSKAGTVIMVVLIMSCALCSQISETATACRQIWAFARDDGESKPMKSEKGRLLTYSSSSARSAFFEPSQACKHWCIVRAREPANKGHSRRFQTQRCPRLPCGPSSPQRL